MILLFKLTPVSSRLLGTDLRSAKLRGQLEGGMLSFWNERFSCWVEALSRDIIFDSVSNPSSDRKTYKTFPNSQTLTNS